MEDLLKPDDFRLKAKTASSHRSLLNDHARSVMFVPRDFIAKGGDCSQPTEVYILK